MTLRPIEPRLVAPAAASLPGAVKPAACVVPGCLLVPTERHHICSRGMLKGAFDYVLIDETYLVLNIAWVCKQHHDELTGGIGGHRARIRWVGAGWGWYRKSRPGDEEVTKIWWFDQKNQQAWVFTGYLKGDKEKWVRAA